MTSKAASPMDTASAEAEVWVGQQVENGATWFRLVVAPLEAPNGT